MFKNMRLVIFFDMFINLIFEMTTSFANVAKTTASTSKFIYYERFEVLLIFTSKFQFFGHSSGN